MFYLHISALDTTSILLYFHIHAYLIYMNYTHELAVKAVEITLLLHISGIFKYYIAYMSSF